MNRLFLAAAAAALATSAVAKEPKKTPPKPPETIAPPAEHLEMSDARRGDALDAACLAADPQVETYDSQDNVLIAHLKDGGRALLRFKDGCDANTMIFADKIASADGAACVKPDGALVFSTDYSSKSCALAEIYQWKDDQELDSGGAE